jgi:Trypsin/PEP-CTERM motif
MKLLLTSVIFGLGIQAVAVLPGLTTDTNTIDFAFVGQIGGASGVLIGPNTVLTARHVGAGTFTLPGVGVFSVLSGSVINHPTDDLTIFKINTGATILTDFADVNVNAIVSPTPITMVGFGGTGNLNGLGTGYSVLGGSSAGIRRKGIGTVEGTVLVDEPGFRLESYYAPLRQNGDAALAGGDSGGGWFLNSGSGRKQLVGINSWIGTFGTGTDWNFSTDPSNFFASGAVNLSEYNGWLVSNGVQVVPEPGTIAVLGFGAALIARRRKKQVN